MMTVYAKLGNFGKTVYLLCDRQHMCKRQAASLVEQVSQNGSNVHAAAVIFSYVPFTVSWTRTCFAQMLKLIVKEHLPNAD